MENSGTTDSDPATRAPSPASSSPPNKLEEESSPVISAEASGDDDHAHTERTATPADVEAEERHDDDEAGATSPVAKVVGELPFAKSPETAADEDNDNVVHTALEADAERHEDVVVTVSSPPPEAEVRTPAPVDEPEESSEDEDMSSVANSPVPPVEDEKEQQEERAFSPPNSPVHRPPLPPTSTSASPPASLRINTNQSVKIDAVPEDFPASPAIPVPAAATSGDTLSSLEAAFDNIGLSGLSYADRVEKVQESFIRAASNGQLDRVLHILTTNNLKKYLDLNAKDEQGSTALIYAAASGHEQIVHTLLSAGASVDVTDKAGWTALSWSSTNNFSSISTMLLENGAKPLAVAARGSKSRKSSTTPEHAALEEPVGRHRDGKGHNRAGSTYAWRDSDAAPRSAASTPPSRYTPTSPRTPGSAHSGGSSSAAFDWSTCRPDQMLVFDEHRVDAFIAALSQPFTGAPTDSEVAHLVSDPRRNVGANVLILAARYAANYGPRTAPANLFRGLEFYLRSMFMSNPPRLTDAQVITGTCYWIGQLYQLTYYIARDFTLESIPKYNARVRVLAEDLYHGLCVFLKERVRRLVDECVLECDSVEFGEIEYDTRPGWLAQREETAARKTHGRKPSTIVYRPASRDALRRHRELPSLFTAVVTALEHYSVPPMIGQQLVRQLLFTTNAALFNSIITRRDMCTRIRAMQLKTNIQKTEEWVRNNAHIAGDPRVLQSLTPTVRLLQFLQLIHTCDSLERFLDFQGAVIGPHPDGLSWAQARRAVRNYTYEVGEPRMAAEVEEYVDMCAWRIGEAARLEEIAPMIKAATGAGSKVATDKMEAARKSPLLASGRSPEPQRSSPTPSGARQDTATGVELVNDNETLAAGRSNSPVLARADMNLLRSASLIEAPSGSERKGKSVVYRRVSLDKYRSLRYRPSHIANAVVAGEGKMDTSNAEADAGDVAYVTAYYSGTRDIYDIDLVFSPRVPSFKEWRESLKGGESISEVPVVPDEVLRVIDGLRYST
ncbi:hypothetical protein M427DRAFT_134136 [Gonapodya prolifera JEL478]|uniref:Dilute domain-containing protein n=1 Tax=Gonapodya prolifera (strain JEL478) TaxID=1344416 RepID=A0A139AJ09_GONPJ|nr:hypothetical protein M427DRAFT_134136 [Gonapodya prolifera JEL478]|eukprot:KXS16534.1 hypothetical protein M427DRAFT_134136 [Gonapodya prolifera JEL478]